MNRLLTLLFVLALATYPLLIYWGLPRLQPRVLALLLLGMVVARLLMLRGTGRAGLRRLLPLGMAMAAIAMLVLVTNSAELLLWQPTLINLVLLLSFGYTLWRPPSMIERFARLSEPVLPAVAIRYTRRVTVAWCLFFLVNGSIATWTVVQDQVGDPLQVWTLYNGLLAYLLMGLLGLGEYLVRQTVRGRHRSAATDLAEADQ